MMVAVENAVKHNEVSNSNQLIIDIELSGDILFIKNKLRERKSVKGSNRTGLKNLDERFEKTLGKGISISKEEGYFTLQMPLLKLSKS